MIKILTDSVASIPADVAREAGIDVVTLFVNREGCEYADSEMDLDAFYADIYDMVDNIPTSSQPSQHTLETVFEEAARAGDEVLGIFISSELSGTYEGAVRAARAVKARNTWRDAPRLRCAASSPPASCSRPKRSRSCNGAGASATRRRCWATSSSSRPCSR